MAEKRRLVGNGDVLNLVPGPKEEVSLVIETHQGVPWNRTASLVKDYQTMEVKLQTIPNSLQASSLKVWELYRVDTHLIGHNMEDGLKGWNRTGPALNFWAVSGQPLKMIKTHATEPVFPAVIETLLKNSGKHSGYWDVDPSNNDNAFWASKRVTGPSPMVYIDNGQSSHVVVGEFGYGIICKGNTLYVSSLDFDTTDGNKTIPNARFFRFYFRQRLIKNWLLYGDILNRLITEGQEDFQGGAAPITEAVMHLGGEPDVPRL